jgi:hypothetical protein
LTTGIAHSPARITGSVEPSASTPSMSIRSDPIMKSTCVTLELAPASASCCADMASAPLRQTVYAWPRAAWLDAFSSNSVLKNSRPALEMGERCGTRATSPRRAAPASVSISFSSTSAPDSASIRTTRPRSKVRLKLSISRPP